MDNNQTQPIQRHDGITSAERYLKQLCDHSFLSLWSYAGIYRDQLDSPTAKVGKEICDLLVVFQEHIIIFSDKDCVYPAGDDEKLNWRRWFKRAVQNSAKQIWGAEKWIKNSPHRLFVDPACTQQFPLEIPDPSVAKIHRIVVAHGISEQCRAAFGGSGCLFISPGVIGTDHVADNCKPFTIGQIDPAKGYIHIFDEASLSIVMHTLDTITDFVTYLIKKEQLIESGKLIYAEGEDDLLAFYLMYGINQDKNSFASLSGGNNIIIPYGFWHELKKSDKYKSFTDANKVSYVWDNLIESFNKHILAGNHYYLSNLTVIQAEQIMCFLAREPRVRRRVLAQILLEMVETTPSSVRVASILQPSSTGDPYYVFLIFPHSDNLAAGEHHQSQQAQSEFLKAYCAITKLIKPDAQDIIGISIEKEKDGIAYCFMEAMYLDVHTWTEKQQADAQQAQKDFDLLADARKFIRFEQGKYSKTLKMLLDGPMKGRDRNIPCPCGSRKKYKKCCGR